MKKLFLKSLLLLSALIVGTGNVWATDPVTLFHETFGNNTGSARDWIVTYSVKSGEIAVYSGASYTVTNAKQSKNTMGQGSSSSALVSGQGTVGSFIVGPLNASSYKSLAVTNYFGMSAGSWNSTYSYMKLSYSTNNSSYIEVSRSGSNPSGAVSSNKNLVQASYSLPDAAQSSTLYLKFEFYCYQLNKSSTEIGQAYLDEVDLTGILAAASPTFSLAAGTYSGTQSVELSCATDGASIYYTTDNSTPSTSSTLYSSAISVSSTTTIKAIAVKAGLENSNVSSATYTITTAPLITLGSSSVAATTAETDGTITVTYNNLTNYDADIYWYESDGTTPATYNWVDAEINASTKHLDYTIAENTSTSSRTAYLKVYAVGDEGDVYSSLITITQAGVDFVTLPFSYTSGKTDIATTTGISQSGLGSDYSSSAILKFDNAEDYVIVKTNAPISSLYYDIKGNSFSGGTFKVQTSANGVDYSDLKSYSSFTGSVEIERFTSINSAVRYIKWIYTSRSSGNVGMGNIHIDCEPVTVTTACYSTYASASALDFTDKAIKAYIIESINASYVTLTQVYKVPANTAVVLYKDGGTTESIPVFDDTSADDVSGNLLEVSDGTIEGDGSTIYALANGGSGVGFYPVGDGVTVPEGKAYLDLSGSSAPSMLRFEFEEENTTSVETIQASDTAVKFFENGNLFILRDGITYDVTGRIVK